MDLCVRETAYIAISSQFEFKLDGLFQSFESPGKCQRLLSYKPKIQSDGPVPVAFLFFQCRYTQKFIDSLLWIIGLHLLGVVVFIFDSYVSRFIVVGVFVLEVITNVGTG